MKYLTQKPIKMHLIRLYKGEDIIESLQKFCRQNPDIGAGIIRGIGAVSIAKVGFFNGTDYVVNTFSENLEIVSLQGNIAKNQVVHLHGVFGRLDGSCVGGHIFPGCIVSVTCEIQLIAAEPSVTRQKDPTTKLNLLELPHKIK
jgi:predicted DNA-binding protein with PD1-like motif